MSFAFAASIISLDTRIGSWLSLQLPLSRLLKGHLDAFVEDDDGTRSTVRLGPWDCIPCPPGVVHGYDNNSLEPVWFQVMLGKGRPETMGYADEELYQHRDAHLKEVPKD